MTHRSRPKKKHRSGSSQCCGVIKSGKNAGKRCTWNAIYGRYCGTHKNQDDIALPNIFLSHSWKDKPFVRKLEGALSAYGIRIFLDEKEIKVGDSIPSSIYKGISEASHLVYVISDHSIRSKWVEEELSIAKMHEKQVEKTMVLPILIEEVQVPTSVSHIKYADFKNWETSRGFELGFNALLHALDVEVRPVGRVDLEFYVENLNRITTVQKKLMEIIGVIYGGEMASYYYETAAPRREWGGLGYALKDIITGSGYSNPRDELLEILKSAHSMKADKDQKLQPLLKEIRDYEQLLSKYNRNWSLKRHKQLNNHSWRLSNALAAYVSEINDILTLRVRRESSSP